MIYKTWHVSTKPLDCFDDLDDNEGSTDDLHTRFGMVVAASGNKCKFNRVEEETAESCLVQC